MLPDVMDLGVWVVKSTGDNAADELGIKAEVLKQARDSGTIIPATLRMEHRESRVVGQKPKRYVVPVLELNASIRQIMEIGTGHGLAEALGPSPADVRALGSGESPSSPQHVDDDEVVEAELVDDSEAKTRSGAAARLAQLDPTSREPIEAKIRAANFPDPLPTAAEAVVNRWIDELEEKGREF
jgi:hypothetical protein